MTKKLAITFGCMEAGISIPADTINAEDIHAAHICNGTLSFHMKGGHTINPGNFETQRRPLSAILRDAATLLGPEKLAEIPAVVETHTNAGYTRSGTVITIKTRSFESLLTLSQ